MTRARDRVEIQGLVVPCVIGVLPGERHREQSLVVDLRLHTDTAPAGRSGRIADTHDYDAIGRQVEALLRFRRFQLLENAAEELAAMLLGVHTGVTAVDLRLVKPRALEGRAAAAAVSVQRDTRDYPRRTETPDWGRVEILFESSHAGLYLLCVDPGLAIPPHFHETMRELEWLVEGAIVRDGVPVMPREPVTWPHGRVHGYENRSETSATLFCCDVPPFIPDDEIVVRNAGGGEPEARA